MMKKTFKWSMILVLLIIVVSAVMIFHTIFAGGSRAAIPPLKGVNVGEAIAELERMDIQARVEEVDSTMPAGIVLTQWPETGTRIRDNQIVILKVSRGGHRVSLPDVRGLERDEAVEKLQRAGFKIGDILTVSDKNRSAGIVVAQNPSAPAMVVSDRPIELLVSSGSENENGMLRVPDLLQREEAVARKMISESGLKLAGVSYEYTVNTPSGMVMNMKPAPGKSISPGGSISIVVATMKKPAEKVEEPASKKVDVTMPGMAGKKAAQGQKQVESTTQKQETTNVAVPGISAGDNAPQTKPEGVSGTTTVQTGAARSKTAKIRYQVPPLGKPLNLKIEMVDETGTRSVYNNEVKGGQYVSIDENYAGQAMVTIYLGGEFVWQDRYQ